MAQIKRPEKEGFLCVGVISQAHNLHGEILLKTFLDDETIIDNGLVLLDANDKEFEISKVRQSNKGLLVKFDGVEDRTDAEKLRKTFLFIANDMLDELDDDEIYYYELKGYNIIDSENTEIGFVREALDNGANTILESRIHKSYLINVESYMEKQEVKTLEELKSELVLLPFSHDIITKVDKENKALTIDKDLLEMYLNL